ncbi:MAG TPA: ABC transporter permease [Puia sp.]|nr:ABC transporter permease [Puia sp.]
MSGVDLDIAKTHLLSRKKQTLIAILGVTFGIAMFILMISFMEGVNQYIADTMLASTPDIHVYNDVTTDYSVSIAGDYFKTSNAVVLVHHPKPKEVTLNIRNAAGIREDIAKDPLVTAVSPMLSTQVFYNYGPVQINGYIDGVDIVQESRLYDLGHKIREGRAEDLLTTTNGILMGSGLAKKLNAAMGDLVTLATPGGSTMRFRLIGTFQIGIGAIDNVKSYVSLASVQRLLNEDRSYITDIGIKLKDNRYAPQEAAAMRRKYGYKADDWQTTNAAAMAGSYIRDMLTYVVSLTLLVVAGFGIYNIMNMTIAGKMKDIAILKAQGFEGNDILQIFLLQSVIIGLIGAVTGMLLGYGLSYMLSRVPFPANDEISWKYFPVLFRPVYYVFGLVFGVLTTALAGLPPSLKAARMDPVAILRNA